MKKRIFELLKNKTFSMFSEEFYLQTATQIDDLYSTYGDKSGYVYVISNGIKSNHYKIGMANNLLNRVKSYKTAFHDDVIIHAFLQCSNCAQMESQIHKMFKDVRTNGEFFLLTSSHFLQLQKMEFLFPTTESKASKNLEKMITSVRQNFYEADLENDPFFLLPVNRKIYNSDLKRICTDSTLSDKAISQKAKKACEILGYQYYKSSDQNGRFIIFKDL